MKELKTFLLLLSMLLIMSSAFLPTQGLNENFILKSVVQEVDTSKWIAPESANELVNPIEADEDYIMEGEMLYKKHCRSCHGKLGDGTGSGAADISTVPTDFTLPDFLEQSDGSMFWKISEGKDDMESYKKKLSEEEVWITVVYIKTFAKSE